MATPPTEETRMMFKLLVDQQWHNYEEVKEALALTIAPGKAYRKYQDRLEKERKRRGVASTDTPLSEQAQILYGQREIAQATISSWCSRGGLLSEGKRMDRRIKINPEYQPSGADVIVRAPASGELQGAGCGEGSTEVPLDDSGASVEQGRVLVEVAAPVMRVAPPASPVPASPVPASGEVALEIQQLLQGVDVSKIGVCSLCQLLTVDSVAHADWHQEQDRVSGDREMGLIDDKALRSLFDNALTEALDHFQSGLQSFLEQRFSEINTRMASLRLQAYPGARWAVRPKNSTDSEG